MQMLNTLVTTSIDRGDVLKGCFSVNMLPEFSVVLCEVADVMLRHGLHVIVDATGTSAAARLTVLIDDKL